MNTLCRCRWSLEAFKIFILKQRTSLKTPWKRCECRYITGFFDRYVTYLKYTYFKRIFPSTLALIKRFRLHFHGCCLSANQMRLLIWLANQKRLISRLANQVRLVQSKLIRNGELQQQCNWYYRTKYFLSVSKIWRLIMQMYWNKLISSTKINLGLFIYKNVLHLDRFFNITLRKTRTCWEWTLLPFIDAKHSFTFRHTAMKRR